jgi:hypothetical protein
MTQPTLHVALLSTLHLVLDDRTLCGRRVNLDRDAYADDLGLDIWNHATAYGHCGRCVRALAVRREDALR